MMAIAVDKEHCHVDFHILVLMLLLVKDFDQIVAYSNDLIKTKINYFF